MSWKMMAAAPHDKNVVVMTDKGEVGVARWIDPSKPYGRFHRISGWCLGNKAVKPILWTELPTEYEIDVGLHA